ncbi:MAG: hypothetical protein PHF00_11310 [Elusimicrobia bacterium]|nr:hypothetical protein [Elusimicrobiota bacterium]
MGYWLASWAVAAALCLPSLARAQDEGEGVPAEQPYEVQSSSGSEGAPDSDASPDQGNAFNPYKGSTSGGRPARGHPANEDPAGSAVLYCEQGPDTPARHRPPYAKPFPVASNQYRYWFNAGLIEKTPCCHTAEFEGRDLVWACRRTIRALTNSAGCRYEAETSSRTVPSNSAGVTGAGAISKKPNLTPEIQERIRKIQSTVCEGLNKFTEASGGNNLDKNCDAMVKVYRDYIDYVDVALWFKGKFWQRCVPTPHDTELIWPDLPPPPPAK